MLIYIPNIDKLGTIKESGVLFLTISRAKGIPPTTTSKEHVDLDNLALQN